MCHILSQLNILCTSLENDTVLKITTVYRPHVTVFYLFRNLPDSIEAECSIYTNIQYFVSSKNGAWNFTRAVRYSLPNCSDTILC